MKKLVLVISAVLMGAVAHSGVLYWQVSPTPADLTGSEGDTITYSYATIYLVNKTTGEATLLQSAVGNDTEKSWNVSQSTFADNQATPELADIVGAYFEGDYDYATQTFMIDLWNSSNEVVGRAYSTGDMQQYIKNTAEFNSSFEMMNSSWTVTSAVPEPTSGMMLLMGMALLALRRRKAA